MESQEDIMKGALLLEQRGKEFYTSAARSAENKPVQELFLRLAEEEGRHIEILSKAYAELVQKGEIRVGAQTGSPVDVPRAVLSEELKRTIATAGYEAAAIYAAMALEEKAVAFYAQNAKTATGDAKALYEKLAAWERTHLELLTALDEDLRQRIWHDQRFWPVF